ncbi:MAG: hypothetical protein ACI90V_008101 [Bacillariaceae sp.]|jgi:hypothetical protein
MRNEMDFQVLVELLFRFGRGKKFRRDRRRSNVLSGGKSGGNKTKHGDL